MNSLFLLLVLFSTLFAQFPNIRVSSATSTDANETSIAINPIDTSNLVAGANIRYYYYSTNGGYNWTQGNLTSPLGVWGDPCVVFDLNGNCYFGHLSNPSSGGYWIDRIVVQKSTNKGINWSSGVGIGYNPPTRNQDKEWLAVDWTNSPYRNYIYVAWTEFDSYGSTNPMDSTRILFSRSTDGGLTFSAPVRVSDKGGDCIDSDNTVEGAVPAIGPNGEVYLAWAGPLGLVFDKSIDGGVTWGFDKIVTSIPGGWDFSVPGIYRCNGLPVTACDISNSPYRGTIYINWSDQRNGINNTDIFIVKSTDGGNTWSVPKKVNQDNTFSHQFFTWMIVDPTTGYIYVVYYDRRAYNDNRTDVYLARSTDGGETFTEFKISQSPFIPTSSVFFGDYTNVTALHGKVYPIWTRMDNGQRSIWMSIFRDTIQIQPSSNFLLTEGWNLLSVSLKRNNMFYKDIFPGSNSLAYSYANGYISKDTLEVGRGYWLKFPAAQNVTLIGLQQNELTITINEGWNLIGSLNGLIPVHSIVTSPPGILLTPFFEYNNGYNVVTELRKGRGYWVKASSAGTLTLSLSGLVKGNVHTEDESDFSRIIFETNNGKMILLSSNQVINKEYFSLPPEPPTGAFDVRFVDNTRVIFNGEENYVRINSDEFPVRIKFETENLNEACIITLLDNTIVKLFNGETYLLKSKEESLIKLKVMNVKKNLSHIKERFFVSEAYPNPFNSSTKIKFYIPEINEKAKSFLVRLNFYDLIGRRFASFEDKATTGYQDFVFDSDKFNLTSGIYFYEVIVNDYENINLHREFKKIVLIK